MKKVKLMLVSLSVLAVVGAALAFKAKDTGEFCTAPLNQDGKTCPQNCPNDRFLTLGQGDFICTQTTNGTAEPCKNVLCDTSIQAEFEN
jgi:hypothetical protein